MDILEFILANSGVLLAIAFVLFNLFAWMMRRYRERREQERYGHYAPAVRYGRLNYEDYKKRREG